MRDVTTDDMDSAARGLRMVRMSDNKLAETIAFHTSRRENFASRVIVKAAQREVAEREAYLNENLETK